MDIEIIGIAGTGKMGSSIAISAVMAGYDVILCDSSKDSMDKASHDIENQPARFVQKGTISGSQEETVGKWKAPDVSSNGDCKEPAMIVYGSQLTKFNKADTL